MNRQDDLFGGDPKVTRDKGYEAILKFTRERLAEAFAYVGEPVLLRGRNGVPLFALFFMVSTAAVQRRLAAAVQSLERHGFPEAHDDRLKGHHGILARLLSIKHDCGIGYNYATAAEVLNAIQQSIGSRRSEWSLYLIAVRTYATPINEALSRWYKPWVEEVRRGVRDQDPSYLRDPIYDRLLSLLFPDMANALAKPKGKRSLSQDELHGSRPRLSSPPPAVDPRTLRGKALYDWKKDNPEAAWVYGYVKKRPTS